ncbi:MAG TPA: SGNH/GDSL hydrolase family protein [Baekduia sp.]|nr:SGNH/GDSL hydrolase family protein [Baekduia sp.]
MLVPSRRRWRLLSLLCTALAAALACVPVASADQAPSNLTPPKAYYLALGDSLAYGYQQAKFAAELPAIDPSTFNTGYVDVFASRLQQLSKGIVTVNDGCPGETSDSMINGGPTPGTCATGNGFPSPWLHHPYTGSQMDDAIAFLQAHSKNTSPVTINIGANDLLATQRQCAAEFGDGTLADLQCIQTRAPLTIGHVAQNLGSMLARIRAAAPTTEIIVMGLYNPQFTLPGGDDLITQGFNPAMAGVAAQHGAFFADPFNTINHGAGYPSEAASVCSQIAICTPLRDIHPFDNGYAAIADVIWDASGYAALK